MSKFTNYILFWLFALGPVMAFLARFYLDVGYYNMMSAVVLAAFLIQFMDYILLRKKYHFPKYTLFLLGFVIYTIVSDKYLVGKTINIKYFYSNRLVASYFILLLIENAHFSTAFIRQLYKASVVILIVAGMVILYQQIFDKTFFVYVKGEFAKDFLLNKSIFETRLPSIYSWMGSLEISFGFISITAVIISIKFRSGIRINNIFKWLIYSLAFSFMVKSRWVMVNALMLFTMYFIYIKVNIKRVLKYLIVSTLLIIVSFSTLDYFDVPVFDVINKRVLEEQKGGITQGSASSRLLAFLVFAKLYPLHPYFGKGHLHSAGGESKDYLLVRELAGRSSQIHVGYLSLLYYYGIFGAFLFLLFLYHIMKRLFNQSQKTHFWGGYYAVLGFVIANLTLVTFNLFWAGIIIALVFNRYDVLNTPETHENLYPQKLEIRNKDS